MTAWRVDALCAVCFTVMVVRHEIGPANGELLLHTSRQGVAAQVGHDLTIAVDDWSGVVGQDAVEVTARLESLRVVSGSGGVKPLSDRDRRQILRTARDLLGVRKEPVARFVADRVKRTERTGGGGVLHGEFTVRGSAQPLAVEVADLGGGRYRGTATVVQSRHGIKPYSAFLGALKLADDVQVSVELTLPS